MPRQRRANDFPKRDRVVRQADFDRVFESGYFAADETLVVKAVLNDQLRSRLGLSVSRRTGGAVTRNRWKRLIREAFRLNREQIPTGLDLIVRPRKGAQLDYQRICRSLISLSTTLNKRLRRNDE